MKAAVILFPGSNRDIDAVNALEVAGADPVILWHDDASLDGVAGLGQSRRTALLKHFGSVRRIRQASVDEIAEVPGVGPHTARAVLAALGGEGEQFGFVQLALLAQQRHGALGVAEIVHLRHFAFDAGGDGGNRGADFFEHMRRRPR